MGKAEIEASLATLDALIQIFAVLVAVGIVGEVGFGARHWILNRQLQRLQHSEDQERQAEIARLNKEAGDAQKTAGEANERAAKAEQRAAEANKKAEEERLARLKIEARLAARRVTGEQRKQLLTLLHVTGRPKLEMMSSFGSPDADDFAEDIAKAFVDCGFDVTLAKSVLIFPVPKPLRIAFGAHRGHDADSIDTALVKAGIINKAIERMPLPSEPDALRFLVGPKSE